MKLPDFKKPPDGSRPKWRFVAWYVFFGVMLLFLWQTSMGGPPFRQIAYSEFRKHLARREVVECDVNTEEIRGIIALKAASEATGQKPAEEDDETASSGSEQAPNLPKRDKAEDTGADESTRFQFRSIRVEDPKLVEDLQAAGVKYEGVRPSAFMQFFLSWGLPILFIVLIWIFLARMSGRAGTQVMSFGKSRAKIVAEKSTGIDFGDVAGCDEAKLELKEVIDFLKDPDRFTGIGAKIPKGVLLVGLPGTGKTLLAKAVAGEAEVPFFAMSGSDFVEMFVGVGAARVRDLFVQAKQMAPCIVFIDEMDAIGRQRGVHIGTSNDEREQTLNQLLVEMDGFEANAGVIILGATNRPEILDRALLRPGRFDRQVVIDVPDLDGREAILRVHARSKKLDEQVDLRLVAQTTPGFSGADLANALNEAALLAVRRGRDAVTQTDIEEAVEKVIAGPERKSRRLSDEDKRRVAFHEVGHAVVAAFSRHADPVHKVSIVPRGRAALGYTLQLPTEDQFLQTEDELKDRLRGLLGGRAAEEIMLGSVSTGGQNDLERATALARQMICMLGMSDRIGLVQCAQRTGPQFLPDGEGSMQRDCSETTAREIDEEVKRILDEAYADARTVLSQNRQKLEAVASELLVKETLDRKDFERLLETAM